MKTLLIIGAALISGAAYGQLFDHRANQAGWEAQNRAGREQAERIRLEGQAQLERQIQSQQLEEIRQAQRWQEQQQIHY